MCGSEECIESYKWCSEEHLSTCGLQNVSTRDWRLCENALVFRNTSCNLHYGNGRPWAYGLRCSGYHKQCYYPWYGLEYGEFYYDGQLSTCKDKSDQVFTIGETCDYLQQRLIQIHFSRFCNSEYGWIQNQAICTDKTGWLKSKPERRIQDPHNCQASCLNPSPDCEACSNAAYFRCTSANICLHPELKCDKNNNDNNYNSFFSKVRWSSPMSRSGG